MVAEPGMTTGAAAAAATGDNPVPPGTPRRAEEAGLGDTPSGRRRRIEESDEPGDRISAVQNQVQQTNAKVDALAEQLKTLLTILPGVSSGSAGSVKFGESSPAPQDRSASAADVGGSRYGGNLPQGIFGSMFNSPSSGIPQAPPPGFSAFMGNQGNFQSGNFGVNQNQGDDYRP